jgi:hypothetical protein
MLSDEYLPGATVNVLYVLSHLKPWPFIIDGYCNFPFIIDKSQRMEGLKKDTVSGEVEFGIGQSNCTLNHILKDFHSYIWIHLRIIQKDSLRDPKAEEGVGT